MVDTIFVKPLNKINSGIGRVGIIVLIVSSMWILYIFFGHGLVAFLCRTAIDKVRCVNIVDTVANSLFFYIIIVCCYLFLLKRIGASRDESGGERKYFRYDVLLAGIVYTIFTLLYFYPCLKSFNISLIGPPHDNMQHYWDLWWLSKSFSEPGASLSFCPYILYPEGASMTYHSYSFYHLAVYFILQKAFNPITVYNTVLLHSFPLAGVGAFLLIRYLTKDSFVSLVGGYIFAFNPSHFAHSLAHIETAQIQFFPFFVLFYIKAIRGKKKRDLFLASLFFFLNSVCCWYYMVFSICFMISSYVYLMIRRKQLVLWDVLIKSLIILSITLSILSPWLIKMIVLRFRSTAVEAGGHSKDVADLYGFFVPNYCHMLGHFNFIREIASTFKGWAMENTVYLGLVNIAIILLVYKKIMRKTAKYFLGLLTFLILSMGSFLYVYGKSTRIALPYSLIQHIPFISNVRSPGRWIVFVYLFLAIITAIALKEILSFYRKTKRKKLFKGLIVVLVLLLFFDYFSVCTYTTRVYLPDCYKLIEKGEGITWGILDLPSGWTNNERYMMFQTLHGIPIVQGTISREVTTTLKRRLYKRDLEIQMRQLKENNVKYIVIHKNLMKGKDWDKIKIEEYEKHYDKTCEDEETAVFKVY